MIRLLVIGDVVLDRDVLGRVERVCPDAPVPVVDEERIVERAGGAGLAATSAARAGAEVTLLCALAEDDGARTLRELLQRDGIDAVTGGSGGSTVEKVRIRAAGQSLVRLDRGSGTELVRVPEACEAAASRCDAVLVADYGRGVTAHPEVRDLVERTRRRGVPVVWDPHPRGAPPIGGASLVTPNRAEAMVFDPSGRGDGDDLAAQIGRARRLRRAWDAGAVAVTLGEAGALLVTGDGAPLVVPVEHPASGADPCGAGDAFAAAVAVSLASGAVVSEAVQAGVRGAAAFVAGQDLRRGPDPEPATTGTLVATGGCFDVVHPGHVATLERARRLGDRLVVLLNSDASVRRLKGAGRPLQCQDDRAAVLRSLACVDEVVVFDEDTPVEALRRLRPQVFVKGGDYSSADLPETDVLAEWGGAVVTVPFLAGRSTTGILQKIDTTGATRVG